MEDYAAGVGLSVVVERIVVRTEEELQRHRFIGSPTVRIMGLDVRPSFRELSDYGFT